VSPFELPLSPDGVVHRLDDGGRVVLRPIRREDADDLRSGFERLSERSRFLRFFTPMQHLPDRWAAQMTDVDHRTHRAWVAYDPDAPNVPPPGLGVGVARLIQLEEDPTAAEAAVAVTDDHHGRGIGRLLLQIVAGTAVAVGYQCLVTNVLRENSRMLTIVRGLGEPVKVTNDGSSIRIEVRLDRASDEHIAQGALYDLLRLAARVSP
jgi:GNAT superfamily N-acetyltransferase